MCTYSDGTKQPCFVNLCKTIPALILTIISSKWSLSTNYTTFIKTKWHTRSWKLPNNNLTFFLQLWSIVHIACYCFCNGLKKTSDSFCIIEGKAIGLTRNYVNVQIFPNQFILQKFPYFLSCDFILHFLFNITCLTCTSYRFINYFSISLQMARLASMFAAQNATSTSASIVIFTFMRACTIALVVRVNVVSHHS